MDILIFALVLGRENMGPLNARLEGLKGPAETGLNTLCFREIAAVVGEIPKSGLNTDRDSAIAYAAVIETLVQQFTLLPMRYGSAMESEEAVLGMIGRNYNEILDNLKKVEDKFEFGLKVFCDSVKLRTEMKEKTEAGALLRPPVIPAVSASVFREYVNKKLMEHRLEEMMVNYVDSIIAEIKVCLSLMNAVTKFRKALSEAILIDAVFLVQRQRKSELLDAIRLLQEKYPGLNLMFTGPWPPYSFVDVTIK